MLTVGQPEDDHGARARHLRRLFDLDPDDTRRHASEVRVLHRSPLESSQSLPSSGDRAVGRHQQPYRAATLECAQVGEVEARDDDDSEGLGARRSTDREERRHGQDRGSGHRPEGTIRASPAAPLGVTETSMKRKAFGRDVRSLDPHVPDDVRSRRALRRLLHRPLERLQLRLLRDHPDHRRARVPPVLHLGQDRPRPRRAQRS